MLMGIVLIIITTVLSILMLAFFAAAEVAVISVNKVRIQLLAEGGGGIQNAKIMCELLKEHEMVVSAMLVGVNIAIILGTSVVTFLLNNILGEKMAVVIATLLLPPLFLFFGEVIPKKIGRLTADTFSLKYVRAIRFFYNLFYYVVKHFTFLLDIIKKIFKKGTLKKSTMTKEEIHHLIKMSESDGVIKKAEGKMIETIFSFNKIFLNDVMTPRNDIAAVSAGISLKELLDIGIKEGFSRMPVYDKTIDNVLGFVYILDLVQAINLDGKTLKDFIRPILFAPETKKVGVMLREMQKSKIHITIVVDEYGQTAGLCTIEDLIEEIVGEIRDEYDVEEPEIVKINENVYLINAMMDIEDVASELNIDIKSEEFEEVKTLGGLVISLAGRIPKVRDEVKINNARFIVEKIDKHRIKQIKVVIKKARQGEKEQNGLE
ncbi:MAG: Hemolysin C [bacterium ADurb.Bin243]|nr:MAG: Hemolysin C [bacterium ADurb.Bin243]